MVKFLRPVSILFQIVFALALVYFAFRVAHYHFALVTFPFSDSLREGAMMTSTDALVKGLNPFAFALQPRFMNQYGIVYPLLVWPWAKMFGTTILVHRIVTACSILASCTLICLVLVRMSIPILLNLWAVITLYSCLLFPGTSTPTIDPGATGMLFLLLTIFIPWFCRYSYKSLIISIICGIIAFYTKIYTFIGVFIVLSFLFLFVSKLKSFVYTLLLLILFVGSIVVVNHVLPAYFDNCFFTSANMAPAWASMQRLHEQIVKYRELHQWILILMGVFMVGYGIKAIRDHWGENFKRNVKALSLSLRIIEIKEPLLKINFPLFLYAGLCSSFVLYMSLGRHSGAMLWYFFQLLSPFLLITAAWLFSRSSYWPILCVPLLIYNLYTMTLDHDCKWFNKRMPGWPEISTIVDRYQHILNTPLIAPLLIEQHKEIVDDGQAEYFLSGGQRNYWMQGWLQQDIRIYIQHIMFFQKIRDTVEHQGYDLIILQPSLLPLGVDDDIKKYYKFEGMIMVYAPQDRRAYPVTFWKPI